ncbi:hypothetical protein [Streptomyces justiciae]|uniref:hypothetical protein n=1 Tax=Streptomyces justiciae TaxID=2780140 RepID=UPI00187F623C|nr:hypothetical protein [Streptomyces justiciae]MBE8478387.1 hypothetical protein [Streptomyces justiciae]
MTSRPPAVNPSRLPWVSPVPPVPSSFQVSVRGATAPEAAADGERPSHRSPRTVCELPGSAPVTSTTSSSRSARV